jgi:NTE family protein
VGSLGLVLSAGGARGAYEAGVIHYLRTGLPKNIRNKHFQIQVGASVGGINTLAMAALADDLPRQGELIKQLWLSLKPEKIYRRDLAAAFHFLNVSLGGILGNFLTFNPFKLAKRKTHRFNAFLDTRPLRAFLKKILPWENISRNILHGPVDGVALSATNIYSGQCEFFMQKKPGLRYRGNYITREVAIGLDHAMASAAIPIIFPSVKVGDYYYSDGGLRLFTPMSPAIQLGADRLVVVELRHKADLPQSKPSHRVSEPTIAQQMGRLLNGVFLDRIKYDLAQLKKINGILDSGGELYGKDFLSRLNHKIQKCRDKGRDGQGLRHIEVVEISPSEILSDIFRRWFHRLDQDKFKFTSFEKMMVKLMDIDPVSGEDLLSYLVFAPKYLRELFDLGYEDGRRKKTQLIEIMEK